MEDKEGGGVHEELKIDQYRENGGGPSAYLYSA